MKHVAAAFRGALLCSLLCIPSLAFLVDSETVLIAMKPEVHCTSIASVVSLFIGVGKKNWPISHFRDRVDRQPSWLLTLTTLRPSRASEQNLTYYQGMPHSNRRPDTKLVAKSPQL